MNSYLTLFGQEVPLYGICYFAGIFAAALVAVFLTKKSRLEGYDVVYSAVYTMIMATVGAKLLFIAVSLDLIIEQQVPLEAIIKGGFVFYGGLLGGIFGLWIYTKQFKLPFAEFADLYAVVVPLGHAFGRVGCFFSGCCYGMPYDGPLAVTYHATSGTTPLEVPLFPIQLVEAGSLVLLFVVLLVCYCRCRDRIGTVSILYLVSYPTIRFLLEFFRYDSERGGILGLSTSQWISLALLAVAVFLIVKRKRSSTKNTP